MTNHKIDNSIKDYGKVVLWQYDRAYRLLSILKHIQVLFVCAVERFWDFWREKALAIDTCGSFGHSVWGIFLGVPTPTIVDETGERRYVIPAVYKKILKGAFFLTKASSTFDNILTYLELVFGIDGNNNLTKWVSYITEYGWTTNVDDLNYRYAPKRPYEKGYVFWYDDGVHGADSNWKCKEDISAEENTSFDAIIGKVSKTGDSPTGSENEGTTYLHLIDPEGFTRKIVAIPKGSLSAEINYEFFGYTITAKVSRRRKCGVTVKDTGNMTIEFVKTEYYDEMLQDQRYIFEQKKDDFCPYPLGIKTNEPVETWVFGFDGQQPKSEDEYQIGKAYSKGDVVWRIDDNWHGFHWKFKKDVTSQENTSFNAIMGSVEKTNDGDPFVSGISDTDAFDSPEINYYNSLPLSRIVVINAPLLDGRSILPFKIGKHSLLCVNGDSIPTEYLNTSDASTFWIELESFVLPIQMEEWEKALDAIVPDRILKTVTGNPNAIIRVWDVVNTELDIKETYVPLKLVAYNGGQLMSGVYYRGGTLIKMDGEYRYVNEGGTYDGSTFSGKTVTPDRTTFWEYKK